ncbi:MAG: non-heme haloperoxidase family protein [Herbinix sp.]|jgi:non-heme chloroperoxidase|nr:non-heme haloperoxidase family protein [Herbinix sp.]
MGYYINVEPSVNIYVEDLNPEGNETIVFLHGWPGSHELFEYQFNHLAQEGYRCIGIDQRGFGKSDQPLSGYGYDRLSDDVRCVIDALNLHDITLLGHSTGGSIAVRYMSRHRAHKVKKLVLCAAAAPSLINRPNFPYGVPKENIEAMIALTYSDRPQMLQNFGDNFFFQHTSTAMMDWFFQLGLAAAGWATAEVEKTWIKEALFNDLEQICTPTLIMHGIHDKIVPFTLGEIQNKMIRNSTLIPFEFSGHASFIDQMDRFNKELARFIES